MGMVKVDRKELLAALKEEESSIVTDLRAEVKSLKIQLASMRKKLNLSDQEVKDILISILSKAGSKGVKPYVLCTSNSKLAFVGAGRVARIIGECVEDGIVTKDLEGVYRL